MSFPWALYAGSAVVILTAGQSSCGKRLSKKQKLWIFILCVGTAVLVWTSMYIAFTRPGNTYIDGVQGRYYLPFLPLVWLVLNPERVMVRMENKNYYALVLGAAALILADKSDGRRSRVRDKATVALDIHDRVNYSVTDCHLEFDEQHTSIRLILTVDTELGSVMEYLEIFMKRMLLCQKAAQALGLIFHLVINGQLLV